MAATHDGAHGAHAHEDSGAGHVSLGTYWKVFGALMVLMALTVGAYYIEDMFELPRLLGVIIAMAIAITKTVLIVLYFMHVSVSSNVTKMYAAGAFIFLAILIVIIMGDYFARGWPPGQGPLP